MQNGLLAVVFLHLLNKATEVKADVKPAEPAPGFLLCGEKVGRDKRKACDSTSLPSALSRQCLKYSTARFIGYRGERFLLEVNLHHFFLLFSEYWLLRRIEDVTQNRPKRADYVSLEISSGAERAFSGSAPDRAAGE